MLQIRKTNEEILFLTGLPRSGKSYLSKFASGLGCSGVLNINNEVEALHYLFHADQLSKDAFAFLVSYGIRNHMYESAVGRRINLRVNEESSLFAAKDIATSFKLIFADEPSLPQLYEKNSNGFNVFLLHSAASYLAVLFQCFPSSRVLNVFSHPADVIRAWEEKGYGDAEFYRTRPRLSLPLIEHNKKIYPIYAHGWVAEFDLMSPIQRITRMVSELYERDHRGISAIRRTRDGYLLLVSYSEMVTHTLPLVERVHSSLGNSANADLRVLQEFEGIDSRMDTLESGLNYRENLKNRLDGADSDRLASCERIYEEWMKWKI